MLKRAQTCKVNASSEEAGTCEEVNMHNNAIVHAIVIIEPIENHSLPSPLVEDVLNSYASIILSFSI